VCVRVCPCNQAMRGIVLFSGLPSRTGLPNTKLAADGPARPNAACFLGTARSSQRLSTATAMAMIAICPRAGSTCNQSINHGAGRMEPPRGDQQQPTGTAAKALLFETKPVPAPPLQLVRSLVACPVCLCVAAHRPNFLPPHWAPLPAPQMAPQWSPARQ
jgi:hypothetical protein